jgi:hypothetical protein
VDHDRRIDRGRCIGHRLDNIYVTTSYTRRIIDTHDDDLARVPSLAHDDDLPVRTPGPREPLNPANDPTLGSLRRRPSRDAPPGDVHNDDVCDDDHDDNHHHAVDDDHDDNYRAVDDDNLPTPFGRLRG